MSQVTNNQTAFFSSFGTGVQSVCSWLSSTSVKLAKLSVVALALSSGMVEGKSIGREYSLVPYSEGAFNEPFNAPAQCSVPDLSFQNIPKVLLGQSGLLNHLKEEKGSAGEPIIASMFQGEFIQALEAQDLETLNRVLQKGADVNIGFYNQTPLQYAVEKGNVEIVELLLENGADVNTNEGWNPLIYAIAEGNEAIVKLLLDNGADVNTNEGWNPLMHAIKNGNEAIVKLLLENGADVHVWNLLFYAIAEGNEAIVKLLLDNGVDVNGLDPLFYAIYKGNEAIVQLLLDNGADFGTVPRMDLARAIFTGNVRIVKHLIENNPGMVDATVAGVLGFLTYIKNDKIKKFVMNIQMYQAIRSNNLNQAKYLHSLGADFSCVDRAALDHFFREGLLSNTVKAFENSPEAVKVFNNPYLRKMIASEFKTRDPFFQEVKATLEADQT